MLGVFESEVLILMLAALILGLGVFILVVFVPKLLLSKLFLTKMHTLGDLVLLSI